ncbi:hypothetical protein KJ068_27105 [bacterium]|nr:hypothetical protein [bacterium]
MSTIDKIHRQAQRLPEPQQKEILDFVAGKNLRRFTKLQLFMNNHHAP